MNCRECREQIVAYVEGAIDASAANELEAHVGSCRACEHELEAARGLRQRLLSDGKQAGAGEMADAVMGQLWRERELRFKEMTMHRRYRLMGSALAATLAVAVGGALAAVLWERSATPAYALEQTIEANRGVRSFHIRGWGGEAAEAWAVFDETGKPLTLRMDMPVTVDGPKVVVWEKDKAEVWLRAKQAAVVIREPKVVEQFPQQMFDPKARMEQLHQLQAEGKVKVETQEPTIAGEPIRLVADFADEPQRRDVYEVDPQTKLLREVRRYEKKGMSYQQQGGTTFLEYNQAIDPAVFRLDLPADVMRIDQTAQEIGLPKGELSEAEIAVEVVRRFWEALIAKDYAKAGQLYEGVPASKMQEAFGAMNVSRIVSIGPATPQPTPGMGGMIVPCEIELERDGEKSVQRFERIGVRPVHSQPERWTIYGGL